MWYNYKRRRDVCALAWWWAAFRAETCRQAIYDGKAARLYVSCAPTGMVHIQISPKYWYSYPKPHGVTLHKSSPFEPQTVHPACIFRILPSAVVFSSLKVLKRWTLYEYDTPNTTIKYNTWNTTTKYNRPNTTTKYNTPNTTRQIQQPNTTHQIQQPNTTHQIQQPNTTGQIQQPNTTHQIQHTEIRQMPLNFSSCRGWTLQVSAALVRAVLTFSSLIYVNQCKVTSLCDALKPERDVIAEVINACSLLHGCSQRHNLKTWCFKCAEGVLCCYNTRLILLSPICCPLL